MRFFLINFNLVTKALSLSYQGYGMTGKPSSFFFVRYMPDDTASYALLSAAKAVLRSA